MRVREWMQPLPETATPEMPVAEAYRRMRRGGFRHLPVIEGGRLVGIVSDRDLPLARPEVATPGSVQAADQAMARLAVRDVMSREVTTVDPDRPVEEAARVMLDLRVGSLPVVDEGRLVGILTETDLLRAWVSG
ncbi:MAG TPA: CBS domain-containing protein [Thermodesulfobacteriota bacterium]